MQIVKVEDNKKQHLDLLLLADEQEDMIDRYLERGDMYCLSDEGAVKSVCVVTEEPNGVLELKNIATTPDSQGKGYGSGLIDHILNEYRGKCAAIQVGTGDCPGIVSFYNKCGFEYSHRVKNFFTDNYDEPMYEDGTQLVDMIYLKQWLS